MMLPSVASERTKPIKYFYWTIERGRPKVALYAKYLSYREMSWISISDVLLSSQQIFLLNSREAIDAKIFGSSKEFIEVVLPDEFFF